MDLFEVVNKEQRPVPTDLVASIIFNRVTEERGKPEPGKISLPALRKTAGVAVSHYVSQRVPWAGHIQGVNETKDVVNRPLHASSFACRMEDDWSPKSFKEKLSRLEEWVQSETWHRETGQDIVRGSGNRAAIAVVVERMRTLYYEPLTGLPEE